uniref:Phospholipase/carboxylesterase/thioesterase domain-containing protein n=1 Tax=Noctiluca scintillans TaxID=2966 RepID=A0A7S1A916_NOCSC
MFHAFRRAKSIHLSMTALMSTAVRLGARSPDSLVVLFHGLTGDVRSLQTFCSTWIRQRPTTQFVFVEAQHTSARGGRDWFKFQRSRDDCANEEEFLEEVVFPAIRRCQDEVSAALDELQTELELANDRVVLAGFSQGAAVAAYAGLARGVAGVLPMGGPCPPRKQLLPEPGVTKVCAVLGDSDPYVKVDSVQGAFARYPGRVHSIPGLGHTVGEVHVEVGSSFLAELFD